MENSKIIEQIQRFLEKTIEKKIPWKYSNSSDIRWIRQDGNRLFTVIIQCHAAPIALSAMKINTGNTYILTIQATNPNEIVLQVNSQSLGLYGSVMENLFNEAMKVSQESSSDIIDKLLGDL